VACIAEELANAAMSLFFGTNFIENVVPIPRIGAGRPDCLSVQIEMELARLLRCRFRNALKSNCQGSHQF
jgi:hypothetical protein